MSQVQDSKKLRIAFVHPDLGIGELDLSENEFRLTFQEVPSGWWWMRQ
jgi:hypothetical protein